MKQELENLWRDEHEAVYELTSVFIHRGATPQWGHYFFYSRHLPENPDAWFKYNDSEVSVVSKDEVLANTTGSTANPYMVRRGPVCLLFASLLILFSAACVCKERVGHD
jgi:ubiquitin carboxyl-terminal hydrolase 25/28